VKPYGLFVKLNNGCTGLLHNSCIPPAFPSPAVGHAVEVQIVSLDEANRRVALSIAGDRATG
jgi:ribosomal protein S1